MRPPHLAAAAALALAGAALVAPPAQAATTADPSCVYRIVHKAAPPRDVLTWTVTNQGTWSFGAVVFVHLTDLNVDQRYSARIDPTTHKASMNLTRKTGGHPYSVVSVSLNGRHVPDDGERIGVGCTTT